MLLDAPPLARAPGSAATIALEQRAFRSSLASRLPDARIGWRYRLVANGFSLTLPNGEVPRLEGLPGVRAVLPAGSYEPQLTTSPQQIGAPALWGTTLDTAGQGVKIGIIDSGIDPDHPFFDPSGYAMPAGFPRGQQQFTTAKVIVARVFAPKSATAPTARVAFSQDDSSHGTHVAGIAAGNADTPTGQGRVSGVAPRAYLGNYKVFVETDTGLSPNANSPAIVAAIEAAVSDGMDVINFSGGEPEIEPRRDIVALALDAAAAAGVVPVIAAGNDYNDFGAGSVSSPGNSERAITVGAVEIGGSPAERTHADFSSVGPTTISLRLKPDVAAPGVDVLSSISGGGWASASGTSMASPHVAGAAALLRQRHPAWTVEQLKSALVQSGVDAVDERDRAVGPRFQGGGVVALQRADQPALVRRADCGLVRPASAGAGRDANRRPGRRRRRRRNVERRSCRAQHTERQSGATIAPDDRHRSRRAHRVDIRGSRLSARRPGRVRRAQARLRCQAGARLGTRERRSARATQDPGSGQAGALPRHDRSAGLLRDALPLSGDTERRWSHDHATRSRACLQLPNRQARRKRRRRNHAAPTREPRRTADRRRARREPTHGLRGAPAEPQPVHGRVPRAPACGGGAIATAGRVRGRLRQRRSSRRGIVHVPVLDERRHTPHRPASNQDRPRGAGRGRAVDAGAGVYPDSIAAVDGIDRARLPRRRPLDPDTGSRRGRTGCACASPTTRRRRTPRTSRASCPTRAGSPPPSACARRGATSAGRAPRSSGARRGRAGRSG